jgi:hypothetical protein
MKAQQGPAFIEWAQAVRLPGVEQSRQSHGGVAASL